MAPDDATGGSFADAMQTAQPKDASQSSSSSTAIPQHATDVEAASKASQPQQVLKNNAPTPQGGPFGPTVAEDASLTAIHAASLGSGTVHDGSCVPPQRQLPGAPQAPSVVSAPTQEAIQASALESEADPVRRSDAATGNIAGTPVAFASAASCPHPVTPVLDASVNDAPSPDAPVVDADAGNAPIGDPCVADVTAPAAPLTGKKSDTKSLEASAGTPVKKTLQAHATTFQGSAVQPVATASHPAQVTSGTALAVTASPQPNAPDLPEQVESGAASVPVAMKPNAQAVPFAYAAQTAKHPAAAPQEVQSASAAQPVVSAPLSADASTARDSAPTGATADLALQPAPGNDRPGALSARSVFSEVIPAAPHSPEPAAVFAPTLITQAVHGDAHRAAAAASSVPPLNAAGGVTEGAMVQAAPVRRLEVAVDDPVLGNMDVRAEMRGGALHASLMGAQESAASMPALHQFLQQHDVNVHTLTFAAAADGVAPTGSALSAGNGMGRDTAGGLAGGAGSGSQQQQGNGAHPQGERSTGAHTVYTGTAPPTYTAQRPGMTANNMMPIGSTLSIHI